MTMRPGDFLVHLGGGDRTVLETVPHDRMRFAQMAGVLLTTAGVATLSMGFALHDGIRASLFPSIVLGLLWGVVIFNLDRFLVLSMGDTRTRGWRLFWLMAPRFLLAVVLAAVVSTPLVLRIFATDITRELSVIHQQQSRQFARLVAHSADQQLATKLKREIASDENTLSGHLQQPVVSAVMSQARTQVRTLRPEVQQDFATANAKYEAWQCEKDGQTCDGGSGRSGNGALAHTKQVAYNTAETTYQATKHQLQMAEAALKGDQAAFTKSEKHRLATEQTQARKVLPGLQGQYATVESRIRTTIAKGDSANENDLGILAQLQALSAASSNNSSLAAARWTVLALFFMIEILPVSVKALLNLGDATAYEKVVREREDEISDREHLRRIENLRLEEDASQARIKKARDMIKQGDLDAHADMQIAEGRAELRVKVQEDLRSREQDIGRQANEYVADEMVKIVDTALQKWSAEIRTRLSANGDHPNGGEPPDPEEHPDRNYDLPPEDEL